MQICIVKSSKSSSVHIHNFDSIYAADKTILTKNANCLHVWTKCMCPDTDAHYINKNEAHTYLVALKNCPVFFFVPHVCDNT